MSVLLAIFYGMIQGLTEFLPVSSSGHLSILQNIFHMNTPDASYFSFDILLHFATLIAVCVVYFRDLIRLVPAFFTMLGKVFHGKFKLAEYTPDERMIIMLIIATLPLVAAVLLKDYAEALYGYTKIIGAILIFNGLVLFISDRLSSGSTTAADAKPRSALVVGLCQMCAILPGLSRSGSTITGGLLCGYSREYAVKFSFLLSIPAILGANILNVPELIQTPIPQTDIVAYICGMAAAALTGLCAMKLLIYISKKANFTVFSVYCVIVGILAVIFG